MSDSRGIGDTIDKIMQNTGVKQIVDKVSHAAGKDCGCNERREQLNQKFPYKNND